MLLLIFAGCSLLGTTKGTDSAVDVLVRPEDWESSEPEVLDPPEDIDQDGFSADEDCDDWNPEVYPGAQEIWNFEDDDCDGLEDIDGEHEGSVRLVASAIFEGNSYSFDQSCTASLSRIEGMLLLEIVCAIDASQPKADLLLGGTVVATAEDSFARDESWSGELSFVSTGGEMEWDSVGTAELSWSPLSTGGNQVTFAGALDAVFLDISMSGVLERTR